MEDFLGKPGNQCDFSIDFLIITENETFLQKIIFYYA